MGKEYVGIDLHRRRSVIYRMDEAGERRLWARQLSRARAWPGLLHPAEIRDARN
jgi:hypothetical protein